MEKNLKNSYLTSLEEEIDKLIIETGATADNNFYKAIKKIINLQLNEQDVINRFDEFSNMIVSIAQMDFSQRMDIHMEKDFFEHIALSLNMLCEELEANAAPGNYVDDILEEMQEPVLVTDAKNNIRYCNTIMEKLLGFSKEELLNKPIGIVFATNEIEKKLSKEKDHIKNFQKQCHESKCILTLKDKNSKLISAEVKIKFTGNNHFYPNGIMYFVKSYTL